MPKRSEQTKDPGPLARYVRQLREARKPKLSQEKLAELAGVERYKIDTLERGFEPSPVVIFKIAPVLGVTPEQIMRQGGLLNGGTVEAIRNKELEGELPVRVPVYGIYPYKPGVPIVDRMYVTKKTLEQGTAIQFYVVNTGYHISPVIGVGDRLTVDRMAVPREEDFVIALNKKGEVVVGRLVANEADGKLGIATRSGFFPEYTDASVILDVTHRLKQQG